MSENIENIIENKLEIVVDGRYIFISQHIVVVNALGYTIVEHPLTLLQRKALALYLNEVYEHLGNIERRELEKTLEKEMHCFLKALDIKVLKKQCIEE